MFYVWLDNLIQVYTVNIINLNNLSKVFNM